MRDHKKEKGSILVELLISIILGGILFFAFSYLFNTTLKVNQASDTEDDLFFSGEYLMNYIESEIHKADEVYLLDKGKHEVLFFREIEDSTKKEKQSYYTYIKDKGKVTRIAESKLYKVDKNTLYRISLGGNNVLCENILEFNIGLLGIDDKYIDLNIKIGKDNKIKEYHKRIYFVCEVIDLRSSQDE